MNISRLLFLPIALIGSCTDVPDNLVWQEPGAPACVDADGDGFGLDCPLGDDCDDGTDLLIDECARCETEHLPGCSCGSRDEDEEFYSGPDGTQGVGQCRAGRRSCVERRWAVTVTDRTPSAGEICGNTLDDDCNGEVDENLFECESCDPSCHTGSAGEGIWENDQEGLDETDDGGLTLHEERSTFSYAWIANDGEGTVSKIATGTGDEEGRYYTGIEDVVNRPSRTAVDRVGDVYVANRAFGEQGSVTKIAGISESCVDRDLDGEIGTSTGGGDVLPFGEDECVLWTVPLSGEDAIPRALAIDAGDDAAPSGYAWVGTFNDREEDSTRHGRVFKLNPADGTVLASIELPVQPYGAIVDAANRLWLTAWGEYALVSVDTLSGAVGAAVLKDEPFGCDQTYGIALDEDGRIWTGGWTCECAYRYDPADGSWATIDLRGRGTTRGVGPDGNGNMWITHYTTPGGLTRVPIDEAGPLVPIDATEYVPLEDDADGAVGVGADFDGHLWIVNRDSSTTTRLTLDSMEQDEFLTGLLPYTYSDFTGFQLITHLTPEGAYEHAFEGCDPGNDPEEPHETEWGELSWEADVPAGTRLELVVRTADTEVGLAAADDIVVATVPDDVGPVDVGAAIEAAGETQRRFLRLIIRFYSEDGVSRPVLQSVRMMWECPEDIG